MQENAIGDEGARALAEALQQNRSLTKLFLYVGRHLDSGGARAALTMCRITLLESMARRHLRRHCSRTGASRSWASAYVGSAAGEGLRRAALTPRLQDNAFGDAGARALAKALEKNDSLETLGVGVRLQLHSGEGGDADASGIGHWHWRGRHSSSRGCPAEERQPHVPGS